jgi:hypothetical protein
MSDRNDPEPDDPTLRAPATPPPPAASDDRVAAAQDRAAAAEHRAETAERYAGSNDQRETEVVGHRPAYGAGSLLALLGALAVAVSVFMRWVQEDLTTTGETTRANDIPVQFLWDIDASDQDPSLLFLLLPAAALILIGAFIPRARWTAWLGGVVALAVPVLYTISAGRFLSDRPEGEGLNAFDFIDIGVWVCAVGAALAIIGASLLPRREIVTERSRQVEY